MAARKAPQDTARGFNLTVQKLIIIVQLLMGDIPERSIFNAPETRNLLKPYLALTQAVRTGDLHEFSQVRIKLIFLTLFIIFYEGMRKIS